MIKSIKKKLVVGIILSLILLNTSNVYADSNNDTNYNENTIENAVSKDINSVVKVEDFDVNGKLVAIGSGCIISSDGKVVTNYHVVSSKGTASEDIIMNDGTTKYNVKGVLGYSKSKDIAILQLDNVSGLVPLTLGDSSILKIGQEILTIGSPLGFENTLSVGYISGLNRNIGRDNGNGKDIQIDSSITHGSSGGALIDMSGQLIGITYAGEDTQGNINFVIPINDVTPLQNMTTLTTISTLNNQQNSSGNPSTSNSPQNKYFPKLSTFPMPDKIDYDKEMVSDDGNNVSYFFSSFEIYSDFFISYDEKLLNAGWNFEKSEINDGGYIDFYWVDSNGNEVKMGYIGDNFVISGAIY